MASIVSVYDARRLGQKLLDTCREIREEDKQKGRVADDELVAWLATQVGCFARYIHVLGSQEGNLHVIDGLIDQMVEESEKITRYMMARAIHPDAPYEELFGPRPS